MFVQRHPLFYWKKGMITYFSFAYESDQFSLKMIRNRRKENFLKIRARKINTIFVVCCKGRNSCYTKQS
jgi:hypothetical protein